MKIKKGDREQATGGSFRRAMLCVCAMGLAGWLTSCSSAPKTSNGSKNEGAAAPTARYAVAEVQMATDLVFEAAEDYLRKHYTVTFVNRSIRKLEMKTKTRLFEMNLSPLTTGKTGFTVGATVISDNSPDPDAARRMADEILAALKNSPQHAPVVPLKSSASEPAEPAK